MQNKKGLIALIAAIVVAVLVAVLLFVFSSKNFTVSFDSNGGSAVVSQNVKKGETVTKPTDPTRVDYTFAGWYLELTDTEKFDFSTKVTKNITLHAKWIQDGESSQCTLTCDKGYTLDKDNCKCVKDDDEPSEKVDVAKVTANRTSVSLKVGNTFTVKLTITPNNATDKNATWKSSNSKVATVDKNGKITAVGAGTAKVTATVDGKSVTITVSVAANDQPTVNPGGSTSNPGTSTTDTPSNPNTPSNPDTPTTPEVKECTVTFNSNKGTAVASQKVECGKTLNLSKSVTTRNNYEFSYWYVGNEHYNANDTITVKEDMTLTAEWEAVYNYTVTTHNGNDQEPQVEVRVYLGDSTTPISSGVILDGSGNILALWDANNSYYPVDKGSKEQIKQFRYNKHTYKLYERK